MLPRPRLSRHVVSFVRFEVKGLLIVKVMASVRWFIALSLVIGGGGPYPRHLAATVCFAWSPTTTWKILRHLDDKTDLARKPTIQRQQRPVFVGADGIWIQT